MIRAVLFAILGLLFLVAGFALLPEKIEAKSEPKFVFEISKRLEDSSLALSVADGALWRLSKNSSMQKLDDNAEVLESYALPFEKLSKSFCVENNVLYAVSNSKKIFAYDLNTSKVLWEFSAKKRILADFALDKDLLIFASYDFSVYALNKNTGKLDFEYKAQEAINEKVALDEDKIYFGDCAGVLTCFDISSHQAKTEEISEHLPNSPLIIKESLLILDYENRIFCLDKNTLKEKWQVESNVNKILKFGDKVFALSSDLFLLNCENGELEKLISVDENLEIIEVFSEEKFVLISELGSIYIYDMQSGEIDFDYKLGLSLKGIKIYAGKVFIIDDKSGIYIIRES